MISIDDLRYFDELSTSFGLTILGFVLSGVSNAFRDTQAKRDLRLLVE